MALAHLYIGMEALTPVALRRERERTGLDDDALALKYGIDERRRAARSTKLQAVIRRHVLFQGDDEAASKARQASDGFEHSFLDFTKVRTLAAEVRDRTARYLRTAIFDLCELDPETRSRLEGDPYDKPLRSFVARYMWGTLLGEAEDMAAPDQACSQVEVATEGVPARTRRDVHSHTGRDDDDVIQRGSPLPPRPLRGLGAGGSARRPR
jgi:hypothetical protein